MTTPKGTTSSRKRRRTGGRKKGTWTHAQPEQLLAFRTEHRISRRVMSTALGVTGTSIQNWETGRHVADPDVQARLAELMAAGPAAVAAAAAAESGERDPAASLARQVEVQLTATGRIVESYLRTRGQGMTQEELTELVRRVRATLSDLEV